MASTRLNFDHRVRIVTAALDHRFAKAERKLAAESEKLFEAVYLATFGRKTIAQMDALPEGWLPTRVAINIDYPDMYRTVTTAHPRRVPATAKSLFRKPDQFPERLQTRLHAHFCAQNELGKQRRKLGDEIRAALHKFSTLESLLKRWPELEPFTHGIEPATRNLPMVPIASINQALGLAS